MNRSTIIREAFRRAGIKSDLAISNELGMEYKRLHYRRLNDIGSLTLNELWLMQRHGCFTDEDILQIAKEGGEGIGKQAEHMRSVI